MKGNGFLVLCVVVEESVMARMAKQDSCNCSEVSSLAKHESKWVLGRERESCRNFLHLGGLLAQHGGGILYQQLICPMVAWKIALTNPIAWIFFY